MSRYPMHFGQDPTRLLERLRGGMDHLLEDFFAGSPFSDRLSNGLITGRQFPPLNLWEDEKNLYVESEVPGLKLEDLEVSIFSGALSIKGEWKAEKAGEECVLHRHERPTGSFSRSLELPVAVDAEKVSAALDNGILTVTLPKAAAALPRKIEVRSGG